MSHLHRWLRGLLLPGLVLVAALAPGVHAADEKAPGNDLVLKGDAKCTRCHNEDSEYPVLSIGKTRHGTTADPRNPTCDSCHGASEAHLVKPSAKEARVKPDRWFGRKTTTSAADQSATCLACHKDGKRMHWQSSAHTTHDVSCTGCHKVHTSHDPVRDKLTQAETCFACHKEQRAQVNRPSHHPIIEGKVTCSDCHNAHGSAGPALMVRDSVNNTCYTCHMDKRGPFVRNHQPVQENCSICHDPHGTTSPALMKVRAPFICQQCHEPLQHEGIYPGNVNATGAGLAAGLNRMMAVGRNCMVCHTAIHGSNSPANTAGQSGFRR